MKFQKYLTESKYKLIKSTTGEYNKGQTSANSNCYYKGNRVCWVVSDNKGEEFIGLSRKKDALRFKEFAEETGYDGTGDPAALYMKWAAKKGYNIDKFKEL